MHTVKSGPIEVLLWDRIDPHVGPKVISRKGGVLAEIYKDAVLRLLSFAFDEAYEIIKEVSGLAIIRGHQSMPKGYRKS